MSTRVIVPIGTAVLVLVSIGLALPRYEPVESTDLRVGGISGTVLLEGRVPAPRTLKTPTNDKVCHEVPTPDESLVVSRDGKVRWAVVSIRKIKRGKPFSPATAANQPTLNQKGCRFFPHVVVVPAGAKLRVLNSDGTLHNVHVHAKRNRSRNIAMGSAQKSMELKFRRAERVHVTCDAHAWMSSWVIVAGHPYYAVTNADGSFDLPDVPAGTYQVEAWHETLGRVEQTVTVSAGKKTHVELKFSR